MTAAKDMATGLPVPYIVMEYVDGRTVRDLVQEGHRLLPERSLEITVGCEQRCQEAGPMADKTWVCDLERVYRTGDAVQLSDQAGLAVDRALQEPHVAGCSGGEVGQVAGDLLAAFDGVERGAGETAAVGGQRGVGVEQAGHSPGCSWVSPASRGRICPQP